MPAALNGREFHRLVVVHVIASHPVLHVSDHGRLRLNHAGSRVARVLLEHQRPHSAEPFLPMAPLSQLPSALHCHPDRLVHGGSGPQPWVVYGALRTADAMTPFLTAREAGVSLVVFCAIYTLIFAFGIFYLYRLLRAGPAVSRHLPRPPNDPCHSQTSPAAKQLTPESSDDHVLGNALGG